MTWVITRVGDRAEADEPLSRYGEPELVETYKPQAYRPVVFKKIPVIETTTPGNGGKFAHLKETIHSKLRKVKPFVLGFKAGAILL